MLLRNRTHTLWFEHWNAHICFQYSFNELMLPLSLSGEDPLQEQRKAVTMHTALLHQKSYPTVRSTGSQEILVALSAGKIGAGDGSWITSSCHYSSKVCEPSGKIFGEAMHIRTIPGPVNWPLPIGTAGVMLVAWIVQSVQVLLHF